MSDKAASEEIEIQKRTAERFPIGFEDYDDLMPSTESLDTGTVVAYRLGTSDVVSSEILVSTTASISGNTASCLLYGGVDGADYKVVISVVTSPSAYVYHESVVVRVRD